MAKRRGRKVQFNLSVGEDPSLWRFASAQEALSKNVGVLSTLIRAGEAQQSKDSLQSKSKKKSEGA